MHCLGVTCPSPEMLRTPWAHSCFGVHATVDAWLHLLFWWAKKTACQQSCPPPERFPALLLWSSSCLHCGFLLFVKLLYLGKRVCTASLSLTFDGVGGCLGRGVMKRGVAWDVGVTLWPWRSLFTSGVSASSSEVWGVWAGPFGWSLSSNIPRLWACSLHRSRLRTAVLLWGLLKATWKGKRKTLSHVQLFVTPWTV